MESIFTIAILLLSVVIHEVSHGYAALLLGDPTAKYAGRLTLNPLKHLDLLGSIIIPLIGYLTGGFIIGWAKPVPFNPYNLKNQRWGEALVAVAGPVSNILIAIVFGFVFRFVISNGVYESLLPILLYIIFINITLAVFNLVPVPPLDGSKILFSIMPNRLMHIRESIERMGLVLVFILLFFIWPIISPVISSIVYLIIGGSMPGIL